MAGHRRQHGKPTRRDARNARYFDQLMAAATTDEQLAIAFNWWRVTVRHLTGEDPYRPASSERKAELMRELTRQLVDEVHKLTGWWPNAQTSEVFRTRLDAHKQQLARAAEAEARGRAEPWWVREQREQAERPRRCPRRFPWAQ